jgi:hypothetical protein
VTALSPSGENSAHALRVVNFLVVADQNEARGAQLLEAPEITRAAIFTEANDEEVVPTAFGEGPFVAIREQPNIGAPVRRLV